MSATAAPSAPPTPAVPLLRNRNFQALWKLYACRCGAGVPLIEYCPDYPDERAAQVLDQCARLRVELPVDNVLDATPQWGHLLHATAARVRHR